MYEIAAWVKELFPNAGAGANVLVFSRFEVAGSAPSGKTLALSHDRR